MKGIIPMCLKEMVIAKFGAERWDDCLEAAGRVGEGSFLATSDIPDAQVMKLIAACCKTLDISLQHAADAFGEYWVCTFAPRVYPMFFVKCRNAREFLLAMDKVHVATTSGLENAHPPRFGYEWKNDNTLVMVYESRRNLLDILVGLVKGVGKYYKENLRVTKVGVSRVEVVFGS